MAEHDYPSSLSLPMSLMSSPLGALDGPGVVGGGEPPTTTTTTIHQTQQQQPAPLLPSMQEGAQTQEAPTDLNNETTPKKVFIDLPTNAPLKMDVAFDILAKGACLPAFNCSTSCFFFFLLLL